MPLYPKQFIQRLRDEVPVSQIIGARVPLKKKGREYEACCPFHQEKTPSFTVNDQKGFYHCFGCSAHGDSIKFLMEYERLSYPQAIEAVAREAGVALPELSPELEKQEKKRASLQEVVAMANHWFQEQLNLSHGQEARDYLARRGLDAGTIQHFGLGYAPADREALKRFLKQEGAEEAQMVEAGLLIQPDDPGRPSYCRFRDRVMFPILNLQGEVIAFGGRLLRKDDNAPKYLNSPETPLFHKGQILYNWKNAKQAADEETPILIAEGYMDVIALHRFGFETGVAPLGTALTETQLRGLWRYQDAPVLCLDGDAAGQRAMWRSAELALPMLQPGKTLRFLTLPQGQDPDDFLQAQGAAGFRQQLEQTKPLSQVIHETVQRRHGQDTPEQRAAAEAELHQLAGRIQHEGVQHHFRQYFREQNFALSRGAKGKGYRGKPNGQQMMNATPPPVAVSQEQGVVRAQKELLKLLLLQPELCGQGTIHATLEGMHFAQETLAIIQHWLLEETDLGCAEADALRDDPQIRLPKEAMEQDPYRLFCRLVDSIQLAHLEQEITAFQKAEMTEENLEQLQALRHEKEALMQRQYQ